MAPLKPNGWARFVAPLPDGTISAPSSGQILAGPRPLTEAAEGAPWDVLLDAVDRHLIADVPTALLLSSGFGLESTGLRGTATRALS